MVTLRFSESMKKSEKMKNPIVVGKAPGQHDARSEATGDMKTATSAFAGTEMSQADAGTAIT